MENIEITREDPLKICFVCLGNICRSPTAEGIFQHLVIERNLQPYFEIDSAGTSAYHVGEKANSNSRKVASRHGIELRSRARQFETFDLDYFDLIIAMDRQNLENINNLANPGKARYKDKIYMMREFDPETEDETTGNMDVPDPYYGGKRGFERVFEVLLRSCRELLDQLEHKIAER